MHLSDGLQTRIKEFNQPTELCKPIYAATLLDAYRTAHAYISSGEDQFLLNNAMKFIEEGLVLGKELGIKADCKQGCNHCCVQQVAVTPHEMAVVLLAPQVSEIDLEGRIKDQAEAEKFDSLPADTRKCVFLTDEGCSIYPFRPIKCRLVHSKSVEHCLEEGKSDPLIFDYAEIGYSAYLSLLLERRLLEPGPDNVLHKQLYKLLKEREV